MKALRTAAAFVAVLAALAAQAETKTIEGHGTARNAAGENARFAVRVGQVNNDPPAGHFEIAWMHGDAKIGIVCDQPRFVGIREREGRFYGPATVTVTRGTDVRHWMGTLYFTGQDLRDATHLDHRDLIRVRFIRDPWGPPEGDFFFEGPVMDGDLAVKKF